MARRERFNRDTSPERSRENAEIAVEERPFRAAFPRFPEERPLGPGAKAQPSRQHAYAALKRRSSTAVPPSRSMSTKPRYLISGLG